MNHFWLHAFDLDLNIVNCDDAGSKTIEIVSEVYQLYELGDVVQALTYFMASIPDLKAPWSHCHSCQVELVKGFSMLTSLESPTHFIESMNNAAKHHIIAFPRDVA